MSNATINLIGRVVNEPEIREGKDQRKFVTFRLAVNNQFGASENAAFYNCTGNEFIANRVSKAGLKKGRLIHVAGSFNPREYQTKNGDIRFRWMSDSSTGVTSGASRKAKMTQRCLLRVIGPKARFIRRVPLATKTIWPL